MAALAAGVALLPAVSSWFYAVDRTVLEPYLDEIFHIPQASHYCEGHFEIWDPKITTPPGLYILSVAFKPILGCSTASLRLINVFCLIALCGFAHLTYLERRKATGQKDVRASLLFSHSALNIALFPPLFFFSAMYYTDIASTLSVAVYYSILLRNQNSRRSGVFSVSAQILAAVASLFFRQTNIFWTGVAPLLFVVLQQLDQGHQVVKDSLQRRAQGFGDTTLNIVKTSWKFEIIYDPPVSEASFEDSLRTILSIAACGLKAATQPKRIASLLLAAIPHLTVIGLFAAFILINGSVVLGDKSNHVATINLPQMLYIWPYFAFFSWPLLLPQILLIPTSILSPLIRSTTVPAPARCLIQNKHLLLRKRVLLPLVILACGIVRFNTIVHPFMLADNRHYTFYIFKRLLRPSWVRFAVTPIYIFCGWACLSCLGGLATSTDRTKAASRTVSSTSRGLQLPDSTRPAPTTFVLVWLVTTSLQLCTAPLFEPRYLIVPWLFWRLHLPLYAQAPLPDKKKDEKQSAIEKIIGSYDLRLVIETAWYLLVNLVTGYIFLHWTFEWPLEPGQAQRFMW